MALEHSADGLRQRLTEHEKKLQEAATKGESTAQLEAECKTLKEKLTKAEAEYAPRETHTHAALLLRSCTCSRSQG